ncbi:MAG TPA: ABC transporter substrate-binding protein [Mycobacteriales bacterium]|nr:ABC transporter substrate-binding protein [Mycobacteriales bacterium]
MRRLERRRRVRWVMAGTAVALGALSACGTRLPDSDFVQAGAPPAGAGAPAASAPAPGAGPAPGGTPLAPAGPGSATGRGPSGTGGGAGSAGTGTGARTGSGPTPAGNTASDTGVTATTITIGNIVSKTNPFDPRAFVGPAYGIQAFVHWVNAHGGVHGRQIILRTCDDQGSGDGNVNCVHQLIDHDHVFALVSNGILDYAGASYVNSKGVPDIGSQPIDNAYYQYPHLWDIYGEEYPRDGKQVGFHGELLGGTEVYRYFKTKFPKVPRSAGVVVYNQAASQRFGSSIVNGLKHEGYKVDEKVVNFALPDYDSVAIDFKNKGVQFIYDVIDREGNVRLCKALDDNGVDFTAKVLTPQSWDQAVGQDYSASPRCRSKLWATGNTRNFEDTQYPEVRAFRQQMAADGHGGTEQVSEWALEGWAGGQWFADAAGSCGGNLTRRCVEQFMNSGKDYDAHGLLTPRHFAELHSPPHTRRNCINVVRWVQSRNGWVTQVPDMDRNCFRVPLIGYRA